ncbi:carbohydrate ABC transporter permease [Lacrimispora sp.]|uniref:carbohydrate ABC transporter permease n=1 Tax=Lacrimispora sp. TaxID=2719234 RepID=UPI003460CD63
MKKRLGSILFFAMVAVLALIFISPFMVMVLTSFKTNSDAFTIPVKVFPRQWVTDNYPAAFAAIPYFRYMGNTVFITAISLVGQLLVTPLIAYSLAKIKWKGADIISGLVMATMMIPITVTMVPMYKIYSRLGLTSTYIPLILPAFFGKAYYIVIVRQFFAGIPNSLIEAGEIDGATEFQRYYKIALPLCKPVLTTIGIFAFLDAWSDYLYPLIFITKPSMYTLSLGLQQYMSEYSIDWSRLMAAAVVFVLPVIVCFAVFQRNFVEGIATSGLKA